MLALPLVTSGLLPLASSFLDGLLLIAVAFPVLYLLLFLPLVREVRERERVEGERERMTGELAQRAAGLQAILHNMVDAVFVVDRERRLSLTNAAAARLFGLPGFGAVTDVPGEFPTLLLLRHSDGRSPPRRRPPLAR